VGSNDQQIIQIVSIAEEEGQELQERYGWQGLQTEATFTTVAASLPGSMATIAPGYEHVVNGTAWNRTLRRPLYGPRTEQEWQQLQAIQMVGPFHSYRIKDDGFYMFPVPPAGHSCAFEYITKNWISKSAGGTSDVFTNDADTPLIDDRIVVLGTIWRWKAAKGLDYAEDFSKYERRVLNKMARDASKPVLNMGGSTYDIQPVVMVPSGSWNIQ
jgi:hypothetical protein